MYQTISSSRWHTRFEDDDDVASTDAATNDYDIASNLSLQAFTFPHAAYTERNGGWTAQRLIHAPWVPGSGSIRAWCMVPSARS